MNLLSENCDSVYKKRQIIKELEKQTKFLPEEMKLNLISEIENEKERIEKDSEELERQLSDAINKDNIEALIELKL